MANISLIYQGIFLDIYVGLVCGQKKLLGHFSLVNPIRWGVPFISSHYFFILKSFSQGWAIALFEKERIPLFLLKRAKERFALFALFCSFCKSERAIRSWRSFGKERKSKLLFWKEQKSESLFGALLVKSERANASLLLFWKRARERIAPCRSF